MDGKKYSVPSCVPIRQSQPPLVPPKVSEEKNVAGPVQLTKNDRRKNAAFPTFRKQLKNEESAPTGAAG